MKTPSEPFDGAQGERIKYSISNETTPFVVSLSRTMNGVFTQSLVRDDKCLFSCHFEREREIFLDVKIHAGLKMNH